MIIIDGSVGEGGGQILRTALALSLVTGQPFCIEKIRAGRRKPGLLRQHLTAVQAAVEIGQAQIEGADLGSLKLVFKPKTIQAGQYRYAVGTAGSATLVLQTILPALMIHSAPSILTLEGGTHNPLAPPFDFLQKAFLPLVNRMGPKITATLERPGFYPAGGGKFNVIIEPAPKLSGLEILERGTIKRRAARAMVANLSHQIGHRELKVFADELNWTQDCLQLEAIENSHGPGNVIVAELECESVTEVFTGFGERNVTAEAVAAKTVKEVREYLAADVPIGSHLADQLLLPLALAGQGRFKTLAPSRHSLTNIEVIQKFLPIHLDVEKEANGWVVTCYR